MFKSYDSLSFFNVISRLSCGLPMTTKSILLFASISFALLSFTWITTAGCSLKATEMRSLPLKADRSMFKPPSLLANVISNNVVIKPPADTS